jgi:uncharacterized membrane protein YeaQ/YmgE (transglycosylase-associated protein family)
VTVGIVVAIVVSGFLTGALARLAIPGPDPMPIWLTLSIGLVGSIVGAVIGNTISADNGYVISFLSFGIAILLVAAYRHFVQHRPIFGPEALRFPERGLGVEQQRERLKKLGVDPDAIAPSRQQTEKARHLAMLNELHRAGLIDDDELAAKRALVEQREG